MYSHLTLTHHGMLIAEWSWSITGFSWVYGKQVRVSRSCTFLSWYPRVRLWRTIIFYVAGIYSPLVHNRTVEIPKVFGSDSTLSLQAIQNSNVRTVYRIFWPSWFMKREMFRAEGRYIPCCLLMNQANSAIGTAGSEGRGWWTQASATSLIDARSHNCFQTHTTFNNPQASVGQKAFLVSLLKLVESALLLWRKVGDAKLVERTCVTLGWKRRVQSRRAVCIFFICLWL